MRLNQSKKRASTPWCCDSAAGCSSSAHSAGVSVSATTADSSTEVASVSANCLYNWPVRPPRNATGMNTADSTMAIATTGPPTSASAALVASEADSCSVSSLCCTASTTTIASSTTMPIASTRPNNVSVLIVKPSAVNTAKVPSRDTGTASMGISVARQLCRNRNTTISTSTIAANSVFITSFIDSVTNGVVVYGTE